MKHSDHASFASLTPEAVIATAEEALGEPLTALCRPFNSYINRVYELETQGGESLVAKFYRPGRWTEDAILDEHDFLLDLEEDDIPVIAPLDLADGGTLGNVGGIPFALFPKRGGRSTDEYTEEQWHELGRLIGRVHMVGGREQAQHRVVWTPAQVSRSQLDMIDRSSSLPDDLRCLFLDTCEQILTAIEPWFADQYRIRIHGDCHFANIIYRPNEGFFLIDFDDMAMGPAVQDIWMLLPGYVRDSQRELNWFLEGYETFRAFDRSELRLVEPLRAMRYIHYIAWCVHQYEQDGEARAVENFGSATYWNQEIRDLQMQMQRILGHED